jgi:hypothetical protein
MKLFDTWRKYGVQLHDWVVPATDGTTDNLTALLTTLFPVNDMLQVMLEDFGEPH